jgi:dihydroxy-acid dehydratase
MAKEAGLPLSIDDFNPIRHRTPLITDLKPGGKYTAVDLGKAGGIGLACPAAGRRRIFDGDQKTVTGRKPWPRSQRQPSRRLARTGRHYDKPD